MEYNEAAQFCGKWLPSWTGNNPERLIDFYGDGAFYSDPTVKNGLRGRNEILPYFKKLLGNNPEWIWTAEEIFPADRGFTLKWKAVIPVGGRTITEFGMDIVEITDGKISRNEVFFDTLNLVKAILDLKGKK